MANLKNITINDTGFLQLPVGTTGQRSAPTSGSFRLNQDKNVVEYYNGNSWANNLDWVITGSQGTAARRLAPTYTPRVLIQAESTGLNETSIGNRQFIQIEGTTVLDATTPRSYRFTKLRKNSFGTWEYVASNGYDVFVSESQAIAARDFLRTWIAGELLVCTSYDHLRFSEIFQEELSKDFGSNVGLTFNFRSDRDSYLIVGIKGEKTPFYENYTLQGQVGIAFSAWLP
jgi:hypothetical protein